MIFMTWKGRVRKKLLLILVYSETQYPGSSKLKKMAKNCFGTFFALLLALLVQFQAIRAQLEFIDSPASATVLANFPTTLSCTVQPAPGSISWEKDGVMVEPDQRVTVVLDVGRGRSELRLGGVAYGDAGVYVCRAADQSGAVEIVSEEAVLTVQGIPAFETPLAPLTVSLGSTAVLDCPLLSNPPATITWFYELGTLRRTLTSGGRVIVAPPTRLTLLNLGEGDAGYYVCSAQNVFGTNMTSGRLQIGTPPAPFQVTISPSESDPLDVIEGTSITLRCTVPPSTTVASISWSLMGAGLSSVTQVSNGLLLSLAPVEKNDAGIYTCGVMDTTGTNVSSSIEIAVLTPPIFIDEPADIVGEINQPLPQTLFCSAEADPPATITWLGPTDLLPLPIDPQTEGPLIPSLSRSDEGVYTCLAANSVGEIRSEFTITVEGPPVVSVVPAVTTPPGRDVVLECEVSGSPEGTLVWTRVDGGPLPASSVAVGTSLHLFSVSSGDAGGYMCTVTNTFGAVSGQLDLTVLANPRISSTTPSPVVISASSSLQLACISSGPPETVLTWYHDDTRLDSADDERVLISPNGMLSIVRAEISDTGMYTCNVSTSFTFVLSQVEVIVGVMPTIVAPPSDVDLAPGLTTLLECSADGFPSPHSVWFRTDLVSQQRVELSVVGPTYTQLTSGLELHDVDERDSGLYMCMVENALGSSIQQAVVRVEGPPVATSIQPTVFSNATTASLSCSTPLNFPRGSFSWTLPSGAPLSPSRFQVNETTGDLTISPVLLEDAEGVRCTVSNQYGQSSVATSLQIQFTPIVRITTPPENILLGDVATLACSVQGEPPPVFTWTLPSGEDARDGPNTLVDAASGNLTIFSAAGHNSGTYTCTATNSVGSTRGTAEVTIRGEAVPELAGTVGTNSLRVSWGDLSFQAQGDLQSFDLAITRVSRSELIAERSLSFFVRSFTFAELAPGLVYEVRVTAVYTEGVVGLPSTVLLTTLEEAPTGPPLNLEASPVETGAYLEWELPLEDDRNGVINRYDVEYRPTGNLLDPYLSESVTSNPDNETSNHTLTGLSGGTSYDVRVIAFTAVGAGPPSDVVTVVTLRAPIDPAIGIGVGVALGGVVFIVVIVLVLLVVCVLYRKRTRAGKHDPLLAEEKGRKKDERERKRKTVSGPIPDIAPQIDYSVQGKFTVQGERGNSINLKPKVIKPEDVARPPAKGGSVRKVPRADTVLAPSNDESDQGRIDPYSMPKDAVRPSGAAEAVRRQKSSPPAQGSQKSSPPAQGSQNSSPPARVMSRVPSGIYSEVSEVMQTPPGGRKWEEPEQEVGGGTEEDKPYEEVEHGTSDVWGRGAEEESETGSVDSFGKGTRYTSSPKRPEGPDLGTDESNLLYSSVPQAHVEKKRERRLREEEQLRREESKEQEKLTKQQKKMQEKMEREQKKMEEKERKRKAKEEEKERKRLEAEYKRKAKEAKQRESMGLSNIISYQDIDFNKPGARARADFIDAATAAMF